VTSADATLTVHYSGWPLVWQTWKCQRNVRDITKKSGKFREKILSEKSCL